MELRRRKKYTWNKQRFISNMIGTVACIGFNLIIAIALIRVIFK